MEAKLAILRAIRNKLIADTALTAYVPSAQIARANQQAKSAYPFISIRVDGARGEDFTKTKTGQVYINIYALTTNAPSARIGDYLDAIYGLVYNDIDNASITDSNISIDKIYEDFCGSAIPEDDVPNLYYISARYNYMAHSK
jgi:hypothetical protein